MSQILFIADCITFPYYEDHKDEVILWKRARCNSILRYFEEGECFRDEFNKKADYIYNKYNLDVPRIPYINKDDIKCFLFSALMDDVQTTYSVEGFSLSPEAISGIIPKWDEFLRDYKKDVPLPVGMVIDSYLKIGDLLPESKKGIILHHPYRMTPGNESWVQRMKDITVLCIHNLYCRDWAIFPVPFDVPAADDKYWVHYNPEWNKSFVEQCVNQLAI